MSSEWTSFFFKSYGGVKEREREKNQKNQEKIRREEPAEASLLRRLSHEIEKRGPPVKEGYQS
jgi:hypothetical protein